MTIEVNPTPDTGPEDREVLRKVFQAQMDEYKTQHHEAADLAQSLTRQIEPLTAQRDSLREKVARLEGRMDELRRLAARDGITLQ